MIKIVNEEEKKITKSPLQILKKLFPGAEFEKFDDEELIINSDEVIPSNCDDMIINELEKNGYERATGDQMDSLIYYYRPGTNNREGVAFNTTDFYEEGDEYSLDDDELESYAEEFGTTKDGKVCGEQFGVGWFKYGDEVESFKFINESTSREVSASLSAMLDEVDQVTSELRVMLSASSNGDKNLSKKEVLDLLNQLNSAVKSSKEILRSYDGSSSKSQVFSDVNYDLRDTSKGFRNLVDKAIRLYKKRYNKEISLLATDRGATYGRYDKEDEVNYADTTMIIYNLPDGNKAITGSKEGHLFTVIPEESSSYLNR